MNKNLWVNCEISRNVLHLCDFLFIFGNQTNFNHPYGAEGANA